MTGRSNLYRALAAEAIKEHGVNKMVDFKALAEKRKKEMEEKRKNLEPLPVRGPIPGENINKEEAQLTEREQILQNLEDLIDHPDASTWEKTFCRSVHMWLSRKETNYMSVKQRAVYDDLLKKILHRVDTSSPIPTRDNRFEDGVYRAPYDNRNESRKKNYGFDDIDDDMDDDIPF